MLGTSARLEHFNLRPPVAIVTSYQLLEFFKKNPDISDILILDDTAFSGSQKFEALRIINKILAGLNPNDYTSWYGYEPQERNPRFPYHLWFGIPYMTLKAEKSLTLFASQNYANVTFLKHHTMPSAISCLTLPQQALAREIHLTFGEGHTLTYFDHRVGDEASFFPPIFYGRQLEERFLGDYSSPLIPLSLSPYRGYPKSRVVQALSQMLQLLSPEAIEELRQCPVLKYNILINSTELTQTSELFNREMINIRNFCIACEPIDRVLRSMVHSPKYGPVLNTLILDLKKLFHPNLMQKDLDEIKQEAVTLVLSLPDTHSYSQFHTPSLRDELRDAIEEFRWFKDFDLDENPSYSHS